VAKRTGRGAVRIAFEGRADQDGIDPTVLDVEHRDALERVRARELVLQ
jgi:hypothetical protein